MANKFTVETVISAVDKFTAPVRKMTKRVHRFTKVAEDGARFVNAAFNKLGRGLRSVAQGMGAIGASAGGLLAATSVIAGADTQAQMLAKSVGADVDELEALTKAVAGAGFEFDNIIDLVEEMNNKLGESAGLETITPVKESLSILGLEFEKIQKLSPDKQFKTIANAALAMEDAQKAAAAADILLGGEANKIIGVLRQQGGSVDGIIKKYKELNFRTKESRNGAIAFQKQMAMITGTIANITSEIVGLTGAALAPLLKKLTDWTKKNKDVIKSGIQNFVKALTKAVAWLVDNFGEIVEWTKKIGKGIAVFVALSTVLKALVLVLAAVNLVMTLNPIGLVVLAITALIAAIAAAIIWWDELKAAVLDTFPILRGVAASFKWAWNAMISIPRWIMQAWTTTVNFLKGVWRWLTEVPGMIVNAWSGIVTFFLDLGRSVLNSFVSVVTSIKDSFLALPTPFKAAIAALFGPIGWLTGAVMLIRENWEPLTDFFGSMWEGITSSFERGFRNVKATLQKVLDVRKQIIDKISNIGGGVAKFFGFGDDEDTQAAKPAPQVVSAAAQVAQSVAETRTTNTAEVTIKDETGRAEVTSGTLGPGLNLQPSGAF